jgi:hypothetical protein
MSWNGIVEIVGTYAIWSLAYPVVILGFAYMEPLWFFGWIAIGVPAFLIFRGQARAWLPAWLAVWFMPGTVTCGAALVAPWPATVAMMFTGEAGHGCSDWLSNGICLLLNLAVAYAVYPRLGRWLALVRGWFEEDDEGRPDRRS